MSPEARDVRIERRGIERFIPAHDGELAREVKLLGRGAQVRELVAARDGEECQRFLQAWDGGERGVPVAARDGDELGQSAGYRVEARVEGAVSYTHLTLPTILLV